MFLNIFPPINSNIWDTSSYLNFNGVKIRFHFILYDDGTVKNRIILK